MGAPTAYSGTKPGDFGCRERQRNREGHRSPEVGRRSWQLHEKFRRNHSGHRSHYAAPYADKPSDSGSSPCPCTHSVDSVPSEYHQSVRSEEHTSELQSPCNLVCRLLLEKKNTSDK